MSASFFTFFALMVENPALTVSVLLTLAVLVVNGWTDAPNAIAGAVVTGALSFRRAVALAAVCNFLGVLCVTAVYPSVVETIYSIAAFGGGPRAASLALCAAMGAVVLWAAAAWWWGIPTSESHALAAGLSGAALALEGSLGCIRWQRWGAVLLGLVLSVAAGLWAGRQTERLTRRWPLSSKLFRLCQIPGAAGTAFFHGAQDGQKFIGVFLLGSALAQGRQETQILRVPLWLMVLCAAAMAAGTALGDGGSLTPWAGRWSPWGRGRVFRPIWRASCACWWPPCWAFRSPPPTPGRRRCWGLGQRGRGAWTGGWSGLSCWPGWPPSRGVWPWAMAWRGPRWPDGAEASGDRRFSPKGCGLPLTRLPGCYTI